MDQSLLSAIRRLENIYHEKGNIHDVVSAGFWSSAEGGCVFELSYFGHQ